MPKVGFIKPSTRPWSGEELIALLPREVELLQSSCNIHTGSRQELEASFRDFEARVAEMAALGVDLIHPAGANFLLLGPDGERALIEKWEQAHKIPIFTNPMSQVRALRAFNAKRVITASYLPADVQADFATYLTKSGFEVLESASFDAPFQDVPKLKPDVLRAFFDKLHAPHRGKADALYLIGPAWRATINMIDELEEAYGIPVIHHITAEAWEIQTRLGFRQPVNGFGRLMREMP